jgi:hypothetical protein
LVPVLTNQESQFVALTISSIALRTDDARTSVTSDFMKLDESEFETTYSPTNARRIDKSVGYVVLGLAVVLIFGLITVGMNRIQTVSDQTVGGSSQKANEPAAEIGNSAEPAKE